MARTSQLQSSVSKGPVGQVVLPNRSIYSKNKRKERKTDDPRRHPLRLGSLNPFGFDL